MGKNGEWVIMLKAGLRFPDTGKMFVGEFSVSFI